MTKIELINLFEKHESEYLAFERVENKLSAAPQIHAFVFLSNKYSGFSGDVIDGSDSNQIFLFPDLNDSLPFVEQDIVDMRRAGVRYDDRCDCLSMFV